MRRNLMGKKFQNSHNEMPIQSERFEEFSGNHTDYWMNAVNRDSHHIIYLNCDKIRKELRMGEGKNTYEM